MVTYETRIEIEKSLELVYDVISDHSVIHQWLTGLKEVKPLNDLLNEPGAKFQYLFKENGREVVFEEELLSIEPPFQFSYRLESKQILMEAQTRLRSIDGGGTEVLMLNEVRPKGLVMRLLLPLLKRSMIRRQLNDLRSLKRLIES